MNKVDEKFFEAILEDNDEAIEEALIEGANPFEKWYGVSPLALALNKGKLTSFKYLLEVTKGGKELDKNEEVGDDTLLTRLLRDPFMPVSFPLELIEAGADVNKKNKRGEDPLTLAVNFEKVDEVKALLEAGADINYVEPTLKTTPFLTAARMANKEILEAMIEKGVDVNKTNSYGLNALDLIVLDYYSRKTKEEKEAFNKTYEVLLNSGININNVAKSGLTPLWSASYLSEAMDMLVEKGADIYAEHEKGMNKRESFAHFALSSFPEISVSIKEVKGKQIEERKDFAPILRKKIFDEFRYNYKNNYGNTLEGLLALNMITKPENLLKSFNVYLNANLNQIVYPQGKESKTKKDENAILPMIYGIVNQLPEDMLISLMQMKQERGENINWLFIDSQEIIPQAQPINAFIKTGKLKALRFAAELTNKEPSTWELTNKVGAKINAQSLLSKITYLPSLDNVEKEKEKYENLLKAIEVNKKNNVQSNILAPGAEVEIVKKLKQLNKSFETLTKYGIEVANNLKHIGFKFDGKDEDGKPFAFSAEHYQTLKIFENFGANLKEVDSKGNNIFVNAVLNLYSTETIAKIGLDLSKDEDFWNNVWNQLAYHDIGKSLVQKSIEGVFANIKYIFGQDLKEGEILVVPGINHKDEDGNTPLMTALANGYPYFASAMIDLGADVNEPNNEGETPIMYAVSLEHDAMFRKLLDSGADINARTKEDMGVDSLLDDIEDDYFFEVVESALKEKLIEKKKVIMKR